MNEFEKAQSAKILGCYNTSDIEKGGEGSKGGKVIGHTKSGHPIYDRFDHPEHKNFSSFEHDDAYWAHFHMHKKIANEHSLKGSYDNSKHNPYDQLHRDEDAQKHNAKVKKTTNISSTGKHVSNYQQDDYKNDRQLNHGDEITRTPKTHTPIIFGKRASDYKDFSTKNHIDAAKIHDKLGNVDLANEHREEAVNVYKNKVFKKSEDVEDDE